MGAARRRLGAVTRTVVVAGAAAGLVWGAGRVDGAVNLSQESDTPAAAAAASALSHTEVACPGADRPGVPGVADQAQQSMVVTASAPQELVGRATGEGGRFSATTLPGDQKVPGNLLERGATRPLRVNGPAGLDLSATGALAPGMSAVQVGVEQVASVKGMTMVACTPPVPTSYLLAGGPAAGQSERIVLTNPAPNPVPVTLSVLGTGDQQSVVVPSRSRQVVVLGSINDDAKAPVVKVAAARGTVNAAMVEATFVGATPRGTDTVGPAAQPASSHILPLVHASGSGDAAVRVGVPGATEAIVRMTFSAPDGAQVPDDVVTTIPARSSTDVALPNLPKGNYAVRVSSDEPVVAGARSHLVKASAKTGEFMWSPASEPLDRLGGVAVPKAPGGSAALVLSAPDDSDRKVAVSRVVSTGKTETTTVSVASGRTTTFPLGDASAVWIQPQGRPVSAALLVQGKDGGQPLISGISVPAAASAKAATARALPAG